MKKSPRVSMVVLAGVLALFGFGCNSASKIGSAQSAGPQPATFANLSPADAAKKINFVSPNVIVIHQSFTDGGVQLAQSLGWGTEATTTAVIKSFAPGYRAAVEWNRDTVVTSSTKQLNQHYAGSLLDAELQTTHALLSPAYWVEGVHEAIGTGGLWVSQDAYEDFIKSKSATFSFDLTEPDFAGPIKNAAVQKEIATVKAKINSAIARKDVYLATADAPSVWTLKLNGVDTQVQVVKVTSWFGSFVFLDNPQNPLVLQLRTDPKVVGDLSSLYDFDVTELKDLTQ
jgi:hypothetical protein